MDSPPFVDHADAAFLRSVQIAPTEAERGLPHHCHSVDVLTQLEDMVRRMQDWYQEQAEWAARYRQGIVQCLHDHHCLTYSDVGNQLGITGSRAEQIAKGKK